MDRVYNQALHTAIAVVKGMPSAQPEIIDIAKTTMAMAKTADMVAVVRCKDCIYFDRYVDGIEKYQWDGFCADWARNTYEDWYCSRAERITDETTI